MRRLEVEDKGKTEARAEFSPSPKNAAPACSDEIPGALISIIAHNELFESQSIK